MLLVSIEIWITEPYILKRHLHCFYIITNVCVRVHIYIHIMYIIVFRGKWINMYIVYSMYVYSNIFPIQFSVFKSKQHWKLTEAQILPTCYRTYFSSQHICDDSKKWNPIIQVTCRLSSQCAAQGPSSCIYYDYVPSLGVKWIHNLSRFILDVSATLMTGEEQMRRLVENVLLVVKAIAKTVDPL